MGEAPLQRSRIWLFSLLLLANQVFLDSHLLRVNIVVSCHSGSVAAQGLGPVSSAFFIAISHAYLFRKLRNLRLLIKVTISFFFLLSSWLELGKFLIELSVLLEAEDATVEDEEEES